MQRIAINTNYYSQDNLKNNKMKDTNSIYYYRPPKSKASTKNRIRKLMISFIILLLFIGIIMPYSFKYITKNIFTPNPYKNIDIDVYNLSFPTHNYLSNSWFLGQRYFDYTTQKQSKMEQLKLNVEMPLLENKLNDLIKTYPTIDPSVFVWDYNTQNYIDINSNKVFSTASIIKIPILIDLFKSIEAGQISLGEKMPLTEIYRTEGSGSMQFRARNSFYTIDELAKRMITESDNSASNMLISRLGSMNYINQSIRDWGFTNTQIHTWLPDYKGTNITTAKEMATMLYNIENNENFLTQSSRIKMLNYMKHVHNNRLIQAGLNPDAIFIHKTGDIGTMLGDAGIVITPSGNKYIVVILANRPHNAISGKDFIVNASQIIYNYMEK